MEKSIRDWEKIEIGTGYKIGEREVGREIERGSQVVRRVEIERWENQNGKVRKREKR